tara:strand:+ start:17 stop:2389 length:2373 start_codon:yes stop_codon:yes gene_type:complete
MGFNIGPRVVKATGGSVSRVGNYRIHQFPPEIVTDGLVMHLDTGNVGSLPVNDPSVITDLTGNANHGSILNGAAYQHYYGGTIYMNPGSSTDDYINVTNGGSDIMAKDFTLDIWLRPENADTGYQNIWSTEGYNSGGDGFAWYTYNGEVRLWGWNINGGSNSLMVGVSNMMTAQTWGHYVVTRNVDTEELKLYKNGALVGTYTGCTCNYETTGDGTYSFGSRDGGSSYPFDGYTSGIRGYNRALSAAEVLQNYEATKLRHATNYTGTFNPTCAGSGGKVDVLCIAGGGGGGTQHGGGGGAGGYQETSGLTITSGGTYTAIVGAGGTGTDAGGSFNRPNGTNGGNSVFSGTSITTITSVGGGGGSCIRTSGNTGSAGGSGGGAGLEGTGGGGTAAGGSNTSGQGFPGGGHYGYSGTNYGGGAGGGGAGSVGQDGINGATYIAGAGGSGKTSSITGISVTRAGGGGGGSHSPFIYGAGGSGGGGKGGLGNATSTANGDNAIPRTGSGGGGGGAMTEPGGCGAHGLIVLRYPAEDYSAEVLIIGGGGSGGSGSDYAYSGGGGGAGGLIYYSSMSISSGKNYLVQVGKGGGSRPANTYTSGTASGQDGFNGKNTIFDDNIAIGGGFGGGGLSRSGNSGGSGGGGGGRGTSGGKGIPTQGYAGGKSDNHGDTTTRGGGGGGAGGAGGNGSNTVNGTSGDGLAFSITGSSLTYAQGGGSGYTSHTQEQTPGQGGRGGVGDGGGTGARNSSGGAHDGVVYIAYKGPQRGEGGTIDTTSRPGYTIHKFTSIGPDLFIG